MHVGLPAGGRIIELPMAKSKNKLKKYFKSMKSEDRRRSFVVLSLMLLRGDF